MTKFFLLSKKSEDLKQLELFEVIENNSHEWLVRFINKRMSTKWFLSYESAYQYYIKRCKKL